ncbi:MAG: sigma-54-dependent Fis family transcriptional regulator [Acidobacteriota bacterium]|nr:MAG: sigma-54-dependent Fis family transcriptional regulator [Acidobacteriota bacterium]
MAKRSRLTAEERGSFRRLAEAIFSNPFTATSLPLEELVGRPAGLAEGDHAFTVLAPVLDQRIRLLDARGIARLGDVAPEDRRVLGYGYLFQAFNRFVDQFDTLIRTQMDKGDEPAEARFVEELIDHLAARGFTDADTMRFVSLFYQIRRAYFFIAHALVGDSPSMRKLRRALWDNVFTSDILAYGDHLWNRMEDFSTLLLGETGTGKGSAAAAIGRSGLIPFDRKARRFTCSFTSTFIAINLSQFPESLIESELFGHRKGAFTGAIDDHQGIFERCSRHGSLFLDEIGDLSVPIQIKLLNVIQDRQFSPVGSRRRLRFEGRVIAATNRSRVQLKREGKLRDDFFYRLSSDVIEVPPLRVRLEEYPRELDQLVQLLLARMTGRSSEELTARVLERLRQSLPADYPWPGNVRELEQALRRILLRGVYRVEAAQDDRSDRNESWLKRLSAGELTASELLERYCWMLHARHGSYEAVARLTALDRRTVKKYVTSARSRS